MWGVLGWALMAASCWTFGAAATGYPIVDGKPPGESVAAAMVVGVIGLVIVLNLEAVPDAPAARLALAFVCIGTFGVGLRMGWSHRRSCRSVAARSVAARSADLDAAGMQAAQDFTPDPDAPTLFVMMFDYTNREGWETQDRLIEVLHVHETTDDDGDPMALGVSGWDSATDEIRMFLVPRMSRVRGPDGRPVNDPDTWIIAMARRPPVTRSSRSR